jgi:multidrug efflux pump subunit AcrA (membrane-fusion protein)
MGAAVFFACRRASSPPGDGASLVRVSGNIEVTDAGLSFKVPGRLESRAVTEGDSVQAGQLVARLEAKVRETRERPALLRKGPRPEQPDQAQAQRERARQALAQAEFTPKNVQTRKERVKLVHRIKVTLANPRMELKPGMPADAGIQVGPERRVHPRRVAHQTFRLAHRG